MRPVKVELIVGVGFIVNAPGQIAHKCEILNALHSHGEFHSQEAILHGLLDDSQIEGAGFFASRDQLFHRKNTNALRLEEALKLVGEQA